MQLHLDLTCEKDKNIIAGLKETKLPNIRKVYIQGLAGLRTDYDTSNFLAFLRNSVPDDLPTFCLYNDSGSSWKKLEDYMEAIERVLKSVKNEVYIFGFRINAISLVRLFQLCYKVDRISLVNCEIEDGDYTLPQPPIYQIKSLNLSSNTCDENDECCLNEPKLNKLFKAIAKTDMVTSLKQIYINGDRFSPESTARLLANNNLYGTDVFWKYELQENKLPVK